MSSLAKGGIVTLPAPTMGVDWSVSPTAVQYPYSPMSMDWIADGNSVKNRQPHTEMDDTAEFVTLSSYEKDNTIIAFVRNGGAVTPGTYSYNPSTETKTLINSSFTYSIAGFCNYQNRVFLGITTGAHSWDGTTFTSTAFTGASGGSTLRGLCVYRDRVIQVQGTNIFYAPTAGAVSGAYSTFSLASYYTRGEFCGCAPITISDSNNLADYLLIISTGGDILAFTGDFPGSANWQLVVRTSLPVINLTTYGTGALGIVPYGGDAFIFSRYPANIISAKEMIQSGLRAAIDNGPLAKQFNFIRRELGFLRNVTLHRNLNALLIETNLSLGLAAKIFGVTISNLSQTWLCIDISSGAVSPFTYVDDVGSLNENPFSYINLSHSDGQVYSITTDSGVGGPGGVVRLMDTTASANNTEATFLQLPYSELEAPNTIKSLEMCYPVMSRNASGLTALYTQVSIQTDYDADSVSSFEVDGGFDSTRYSKRFILPISGVGNVIGIAITPDYNSDHYFDSISVQFEQGGPY